MFAVTVTKVDVLVIHEHNFNLFDIETLELIRNAFNVKQTWRRERISLAKSERAIARGFTRLAMKELNPSDLDANESSAKYVHNNEGIVQQQSGASSSLMWNHKQIPLQKIDNIDDIPYVLIQDYDPFMLTSAIKKPKKLAAVRETISEVRRPKSARLARSIRSATSRSQQEGGFSVAMRSRPQSSYSFNGSSDTTALDNELPSLVAGNQLVLPPVTSTHGQQQQQPSLQQLQEQRSNLSNRDMLRVGLSSDLTPSLQKQHELDNVPQSVPIKGPLKVSTSTAYFERSLAFENERKAKQFGNKFASHKW